MYDIKRNSVHIRSYILDYIYSIYFSDFNDIHNECSLNYIAYLK